MKKAIERDLSDLVLILEDLSKAADAMPLEDLIDVAARLKPVSKHCKTIDEFTKELVKTKRKHKEGAVFGNLFKGVLTLVDTKRLDQKAFRENEPELFDEYNKDATDERVTFELR